MLKKLRKRFIMINMAIVTAMLLIIFGLVFQLTQADLEAKSNTAMQILCESIRQPGNKRVDISTPYFVIEIGSRNEITVYGNSRYDLSDSQWIERILHKTYEKKTDSGTIEPYDLSFKVVSVPGFQKIAYLDISANQRALSSLLQTSLVTGLVAIVIFTIISILLARWTVKPVEKAWQQQKQFISDASHELKTPLTIIISNAELLQDHENQTPPVENCASNIIASSHQMKKLVEGMLELARADNGQVSTHFEKINLSQIVTECSLPFEALFFENQLVLQCSIASDIYIKGSLQYMKQLVDILLDNAQKYSAKGIVEVSLMSTNANQCLLTVSNPGTPIPKENLEKIFQRFYREEEARNTKGSFGLGLSIAQRIVQEHRGKIWAESNPSGNRFCVLLPCADVEK